MYSIIIPVYNKADVLSTAIESVLRQSISDWEVIIIDDGSKDDFESAVAPYLSDKRIRVFRQPNAGVSAARNRGIRNANGDYLCFLDADDEFLPERLETVDKMRKIYPDAPMYITAFRISFPNGKSIDISDAFLEKGIYKEDDLFGYMERMSGRQFTNTCSCCVAMEALRHVGMFEEGVPIGEDTDLFLRIAAYGSCVLCGDVCAVYHRELSTATRAGSLNFNWSFEKRESKFLSDNSIPKEKRNNIRLHIERFRIHKARHFLMNGDRASAKAILDKIEMCPALRKRIFITRVMMLTPVRVLQTIYRIEKKRKPF